MTHMPPSLQVPPSSNEAQQLLLPLTTPPTNTRIPLDEVWPSLTPQQRQQLFRQLITVCYGLLRPLNRPVTKEVADDTE